jgi:hypothetical protein
MEWTTNPPESYEYYWAIPVNEESMLDGSPEIVKVYFDGKIKVFRPNDDKTYKIEDFKLWGNKPLAKITKGRDE